MGLFPAASCVVGHRHALGMKQCAKPAPAAIGLLRCIASSQWVHELCQPEQRCSTIDTPIKSRAEGCSALVVLPVHELSDSRSSMAEVEYFTVGISFKVVVVP